MTAIGKGILLSRTFIQVNYENFSHPQRSIDPSLEPLHRAEEFKAALMLVEALKWVVEIDNKC
jgi:hypothetical protein